MPENLKTELDDAATTFHGHNITEAWNLIRRHMWLRAKAGKYDMRVDIRREYLPRIMEKVVDGGIEPRIMGNYVRGGVIFFDLLLYWNDDKSEGKAMGFGQASN